MEYLQCTKLNKCLYGIERDFWVVCVFSMATIWRRWPNRNISGVQHGDIETGVMRENMGPCAENCEACMALVS